MINKIRFGGASMVLLLIGLVVIGLMTAFSIMPSATADSPAHTVPAGVQQFTPPAIQRFSTDTLKPEPTGARMTIDWNHLRMGGPPPGDPPFGLNIPVTSDSMDESRPSMAIYPMSGPNPTVQGVYYLVYQFWNGADWDIYMAFSRDGVSWSAMSFAATAGEDEVNPCIAITSQGTVIITWEDLAQAGDLLFAHSPDGENFFGYTLGISGMWSGTMTDISFPTVVVQRNPGAYADGIMFQGQAWCTAATGCEGGAHTAFWIGEAFANDIGGWTFGLGGYRLNVCATPAGTGCIPDPLHPSAWWGSNDYTMAMDMEAVDNLEWRLLWIFMSEDASIVNNGWENYQNSDDGIFSAGASDGMNAIVAGSFRLAADPTRHQILAFSTTDGWASVPSEVQLDMATTDQRSVAVAGVDDTYHVTYYSNATMTEIMTTDVGNAWSDPRKVSDNSGTAVNDEKATAVYIDDSDMPVIAWQDSRDGNVNIYTTGYLKYPVWLNASCGGADSIRSLLIDDVMAISTPYSGWWMAGSTHTVRAAPLTQQDGPCRQCTFVQWSDGDTNILKTIDVTRAVSLTAEFTAKYLVTLDTNPTNLQIMWKGVSYTAPYQTYDVPGAYIAEAPSPQNGGTPGEMYFFVDWSDGITDNPRNVLVDVGCVSLTANFEAGILVTIKTNPPGLLVSYDSGPFAASPVSFWADYGSTHSVLTIGTQYDSVNPDSVRYRFMNWDTGETSHGLNFTVTGSVTKTAVFETQFKLDLPSPDIGDVRCVYRPDCWYDSGELATVEATTPWPPSAVYIRYVFDGWSGDATGMSNPIILTMDGPKTVYANWATQYKVTVTTAHSTVTCAPSVDCWFEADTQASLTLSETIVPGPPSTRYLFLNWSGDASGDDNPVFLTVDSPKNVTTTWKTQYKVTKITQYSTITCSPSADCWFDEGATATLTLSDLTIPGGPGTKYNFKEWTGDASGNSNPITLTMDGPKTVTATWTTQHKLTVSTAHSTYTCTPNSDCWFDEDTNGVATLAEGVVPGGPGTRYVFKEWTGDETGTSLTITVLMDSPKSVTAVWDTQYKITVTTNYSTVTCSPRSDCWFVDGSTATLTLAERFVPGDLGIRYAFKHWAGDLSGDDLQVYITVDGPKNITAVWSTQYLLVITSNCGSYSNCGYPNGSGWYDAGTGAVAQVTTPYTDPSGDVWDFINWTGDANGTSPTLPITMDGPKSVNANWINEEGSGEQPPNQQAPTDIAIWPIASAIVAAFAASLITFLIMRRKSPPEDASPPEETEGDENVADEEMR